jgi:hypothetical protein
MVCLLRWLQSDYLWLTRVSAFGLALSWDCEPRSQKRRKLCEIDVLNLLCSFARASWGATPPNVAGFDTPAIEFVMANSCFDDACITFDKLEDAMVVPSREELATKMPETLVDLSSGHPMLREFLPDGG